VRVQMTAHLDHLGKAGLDGLIKFGLPRVGHGRWFLETQRC
jgi:hypothetical protein